MTLRVILQIVPFGDEDAVREIGRLDIFNKGQHEVDCHKYGVINLSPEEEGLYTTELYHYRGHGAWHLVYKALKELDIK